MALYTPDREAIKGEELLKNLKGEEGRLIRYYVSLKDKIIENKNRQVEEMMSVFKGLSKYIKK